MADDIKLEDSEEIAEDTSARENIFTKAPKTVEVDEVHVHNIGFVQRDFINPKNLGFMKVILFCFVINICMELISMGVMMKDDFAFGFNDCLDLLNVTIDTVSFWLIWRRKKVARWVIIALCTFNITAGAAFNVVSGNFSIAAQVMSSMFDIILILYFLFARRPRIVLDQPFSLETYKHEAEEDADCFKPKTWKFWRDLAMYFCIFSIVGHWMEAAYCTLIRFGLLPGIYDPNSQIWSDWLYPFLVYGFGVVACVLVFYPIKLFLQKRITGGFKANVINVFITFVVSGIVCCLIELVMGLTMNMDYSLWDYRDMFGNFMGQICLQNGVAFGMIATLMTWVIYPSLEGMMDRIPKEIGNGLFIAVLIFFSLLWLLYCFQPPQEAKDFMDGIGTSPVAGTEFEDKSITEILDIVDERGVLTQNTIDMCRELLEKGDVVGAQELMNKASEEMASTNSAIKAFEKLFDYTASITFG